MSLKIIQTHFPDTLKLKIFFLFERNILKFFFFNIYLLAINGRWKVGQAWHSFTFHSIVSSFV